MGTFVIKMPDVGEGIAEAELVEWHVKVGDPVTEDMVLAAVMTDKATVEIPSPVEGTVEWIGGEVGEQIAVGAPLLKLEVSGEGNVSADKAAQPKAKPAKEAMPEASTAKRKDEDAGPEEEEGAEERAPEPAARPKMASEPKRALPAHSRKEGEKPLAAPDRSGARRLTPA